MRFHNSALLNASNSAQPSIKLVMDAVTGYQRTAAIVAAIRLGLFTLIGAGLQRTSELAIETGASERGLRILCDSLCVMGLLEKSGSSYSLTLTSRVFLDESSPAAINSIIDFLAAPSIVSLMLDNPAGFVHNGGALGLATVTPSHSIWTAFAEAIAPHAVPTAKRLAAYVTARRTQPARILDVAAGPGFYGIEIAKALAGTEVTAIDWPEVLALARNNAVRAGVQAGYHELAGNAFQLDWGTNFDCVVLANFLHNFDRSECISLLRKAKAALATDGSVLIVEFVPNPDRISPPTAAFFAFFMLGTTPRGDAYTADEIEEMAMKAGFRRLAVHHLPPSPETLLVLTS
ncbi:MAG TPA: class I SAM-dependent methyltransferase [Pseudolabrys sp.]|jgi:ubiquinone/menaquinone biosynthesis C-methylase UbiE|nr:class I SAM-dependent methyltransferase [Pseudolabrys sp.]